MTEEKVREKIKILWIGDGEAPTGFARVSHNVLKNLNQEKYDIHHLAINYHGDPHANWWKLYPASIGGDLWGFGRLTQILSAIKPNIIMILNDPWVIQKYLALIIQAKESFPGIELIPVVVYFPVDAKEHDPIWFRDYEELVKATCLYTKWGKDVIMDTGAVNPLNIHIIPHGASKETFYQIPDEKGKLGLHVAREQLFPLDTKPEFLNSFIVLNANRNQPRKRIDLTMMAFKEFSKDKPANVKLYLHMGAKDMGWEIIRIANRYGYDERLAVSTGMANLPNIPDDRLNLVYNACDVGINTGMGEGWGLTSWEHAATGKPQIVPDHSVLPEVWGDLGIYIPTIQDHMYEGTHTVGRVPSLQGTIEKLEWAYQDWKNGGEKLAELGKKSKELILRPEYQWSNIAKKFEDIFEQVLK